MPARLRGHPSLPCGDSSGIRLAWKQSAVDVSLHIDKIAFYERRSGQIYS
jgi:hypothetical protein